MKKIMHEGDCVWHGPIWPVRFFWGMVLQAKKRRGAEAQGEGIVIVVLQNNVRIESFCRPHSGAYFY